MSDRSEELLYRLDEAFPVTRYGQYRVLVHVYSGRELKMLRDALQKYVPLGSVGAMRWGDATRVKVQCAFDHPRSYGFCKYGCYYYSYITSYGRIMHKDNSEDFKEMSVLEFVRWLDKTPGTSVNPEDFDSMF